VCGSIVQVYQDARSLKHPRSGWSSLNNYDALSAPEQRE